MGYGTCVRRKANVPGGLVARTAAFMSAIGDEYLELVASTVADGWTVLSDPSGFLGEDLEGWAAISAELRTRVICLRHDDLGMELAVFDEGRARRIVSDDPEEGTTFVGEPLAVEGLWEGVLPTPAELIESAACISVDLERINANALFEVSAYRYCSADRTVEMPVFEAEVALAAPDNVVHLLWAAS